MEPAVGEPLAGAISGHRVDFLVGLHDCDVSLKFAAARTQVADEFVEGGELIFCGDIAVKITHEADAERDAVQVIAVDVAAVDLPAPPVADLDLAVAGRGAVADHEVVGEAVWHPARVAMVVIENLRVALAGAGVVDHDVTPASPDDRGIADGIDHRAAEETVMRGSRPWPPAVRFRWGWRLGNLVVFVFWT
jgi:hypothetical protein